MSTNSLIAVMSLLILVVGGNHFLRPEIIQTQNGHTLQNAMAVIEADFSTQLSLENTLAPSVTVQLKNSIQEEDPPIKLDSQAISSLEFARLNGDSRSPPINHRVLNQRASQQQIDDPDQYANYQTSKKRQLIRNYIEVAQPKIDHLKEQVKAAKEKGLPKDELAEGEEKIVRLQEMIEQLKTQYPDLSTPQV